MTDMPSEAELQAREDRVRANAAAPEEMEDAMWAHAMSPQALIDAQNPRSPEGPDAVAMDRAAQREAGAYGEDPGPDEKQPDAEDFARECIDGIEALYPRTAPPADLWRSYVGHVHTLLPLLTAERERVAEQWMRTEADMAEDLAEADDNAAALRREIDALQRQVAAALAILGDRSQAATTRVRAASAALSRTATEGDDRD